MADVAFMGDDEDFNIGYDSLDQLEQFEQFEQRREQFLEEEKMRVQPYIRDYFLNVPSTEQAEIFTEMILYISNAQQYNWIYDRIYKIANEYLTNAQLRFNLQEREMGIIAYVHSNTLADKAIQYAKDILLAAHQRYEYVENRPLAEGPRNGLIDTDFARGIPWNLDNWQPVIILEKDIYVRSYYLDNIDVNRGDLLIVEDVDEHLNHFIERRALRYSPTEEDLIDHPNDWVKVKLVEQRTWIFNGIGGKYPFTPNTDNYIMVRKIFNDADTRILFADRSWSGTGTGMIANYPYVPEEEEEDEEEEVEEEEEEGEVVARIPAPPQRVVRHLFPPIREFYIKLPNRIANLIITDAVNKQEMCSITFDALTRENVLITSCFHLFDKTALKEWIKTSKACPLCREQMTWIWCN